MNLMRKLLSWPSKEEVRQLQKNIQKNDEGIEAIQPMVQEALRRTEVSAAELSKTVAKTAKRTQVGKQLVEDIIAGVPPERRGS